MDNYKPEDLYSLFFEEVKYKRIRYTSWKGDKYFIPQVLEDGGKMIGVDNLGEKVSYYIGFGFFDGGIYEGWVPAEIKSSINIY